MSTSQNVVFKHLVWIYYKPNVYYLDRIMMHFNMRRGQQLYVPEDIFVSLTPQL